MLNRLVPLWYSLAESAQGHNCATEEDITIFRNRARAEGLPFLTHGLTGLGRTFLDGIRKGYLTKEEVSATRFRPQVGSTLPMFLYSAWSKVFTDDGLCIGGTFEYHDGIPVLTDWKPPIAALVAVRWLRQLTIVFAKLQVAHNEESVKGVVDRFIANETYLAEFKGVLWNSQYANKTRFPYQGETKQRLTDCLLRARRLVHKILCNVNPGDLSPKHGSGASACRTRPWERYDRILFDPEQNQIWPWLEYASAGVSHCEQLLSAPYITDGYSRLARGVFVPKDYRGPRLISCEPATSMYYQQGLMTLLVTHLESAHPTKGFVNFTDQTINQTLARKGSRGRQLATLDLKDASDLLSWDLILLLWPTHWVKALNAVRSKVTEIDVPCQGPIRVPLRKHAPMGSAVCFPVMALTIWALIKTAQFSTGRANAWIYGDDIIVASQDASNVCDLLESVGLAVNRQKSFSGATPFRESCGKEYWDGSDVTPIYCRYNPSDDDTETASLVSFANNIVQSRGVYAGINITSLVHQMTGVPIIGIPDGHGQVWDMSSDAYILPGDTFTADWAPEREKYSSRPMQIAMRYRLGLDERPKEDSWVGNQPMPLLLFGPAFMCQRHQLRSKKAKCTRKGTDFQKKLYRIKRPRPVDMKIQPESWGYVLRSSLIGGDLGFTESVTLAKRVVYKYGWVALDW